MNHPYSQPGLGAGNPQPYGRQPDYFYPQVPQQSVGGGTAITAGVLAILLGLFCIGRGALALVELRSLTAIQNVSNLAIDFLNTDGSPEPRVHINTTPYYVVAAIGILAAALFIVGGTMLLNHKTGGRILLAIVSGIALAAGLAATVIGFATECADIEFSAFVAIPVVAVTLYLTLCVSTKRWCEAGGSV